MAKRWDVAARGREGDGGAEPRVIVPDAHLVTSMMSFTINEG